MPRYHYTESIKMVIMNNSFEQPELMASGLLLDKILLKNLLNRYRIIK